MRNKFRTEVISLRSARRSRREGKDEKDNKSVESRKSRAFARFHATFESGKSNSHETERSDESVAKRDRFLISKGRRGGPWRRRGAAGARDSSATAADSCGDGNCRPRPVTRQLTSSSLIAAVAVVRGGARFVTD